VGTPVLTSITITPQTVTIYQGTAIQLKATGGYADGSSVDVTNTVTWSSSANTVATVTAQGLAQSVGLGTATISAAAQSVTGTASLTVMRPFAWSATGPNGTSAAVSSGGLASFGLALAPDQNFKGLVTFACANLPPNSVCTIDPPSADVANGNPVNVAVNIKTGPGTSAQSHAERMGWELVFATLSCFMLVLPISRPKWARRFAAATVLLLIGLTCLSCGGGTPAASGATPAGTYTVVVAAASTGNATQNIQLTITVQ
jgi:hypothetical protein